MNRFEFIVSYEQGYPFSEEELAEAFQSMIDDGMVWKLQGSYGRKAMELIEAGLCHFPGKGEGE